MVWGKDYTSSQEPMRNGLNLNGWQCIDIKVIFAVENLPLFHVRFHWNERLALFCRFYMRCKLYFRYHIRLMFTLNTILCIAVTRPCLTPFFDSIWKQYTPVPHLTFGCSVFSESIGDTDPSKECGPDWVTPGSRRFKVLSWQTDSVAQSHVSSQIVSSFLSFWIWEVVIPDLFNLLLDGRFTLI